MQVGHAATRCTALQCADDSGTVLAAMSRFRYVALQHTATRYSTLQHTATRCKTLQHAADSDAMLAAMSIQGGVES